MFKKCIEKNWEMRNYTDLEAIYKHRSTCIKEHWPVNGPSAKNYETKRYKSQNTA